MLSPPRPPSAAAAVGTLRDSWCMCVHSILVRGCAWRPRGRHPGLLFSTVHGVLQIFETFSFAYVRFGPHTSGIRNKNNMVSRNY